MKPLRIRRILVALDTSADSLAALEGAAALAAALDAELIGMFVEDIDIIRVAGLPFAQEVRYPSAALDNVDAPRIERQLRSQANRARQQLRAIADRMKVVWEFRVVRGPVSDELLAASVEADLLALGRVSRSLRHATRMGSTARAAVSMARRPILLMHPGVNLDRPVLLIYDGSPESQPALSAAMQLAQVSGSLRVLVCAPDASAARQCEKHIRNEMQGSDIELEFRRLFNVEPETLAYVLRLSGVELLVFGTMAQFPPETIQAILDELEHPILIVR